MEKKPRAAGDGQGGGEASGSGGGGLVDILPEALLVEVVGRVGLEAACSAAASCRAVRGAAGAALSSVASLELWVSLFASCSLAVPASRQRWSPFNLGFGRCCRRLRRRMLSRIGFLPVMAGSAASPSIAAYSTTPLSLLLRRRASASSRCSSARRSPHTSLW